MCLDRCHGPGGGGSGGHILSNGLNLDLAIHTAGGTAGLGFNSSACADGNNSSEPGSAGLITSIQSINIAEQPFTAPSIVTQAPNLSLCEGEDGLLGIVAQGVDLEYRWQVDRGNGLEDLSNPVELAGQNVLRVGLKESDLQKFVWLICELVPPPQWESIRWIA